VQTVDKPLARQRLLDGLEAHLRDGSRFGHPMRRFCYSKAVHYLVEQTSAYWLIDLIANWCVDRDIQSEALVICRLTVNQDGSAVVVASDRYGNEMTRQTIPDTDFPLDEIALLLDDVELVILDEN
jgi:hypothetical protein